MAGNIYFAKYVSILAVRNEFFLFEFTADTNRYIEKLVLHVVY